MSINTPKYHPDLEENLRENNSQNPEKVQQKLEKISQNIDSKNPEIQKIFSEISGKINNFIQNNQSIPTAVTNILDTIEKNQKPTAIAVNTLQKILAS